jgi:Fe-S cluster biogenesis protein NfuA/nitrite reductase/ring-hydroxylating ferredoxin subunit
MEAVDTQPVLERIQRLTAELERLPPSSTRDLGEQMTAAVVDMYGEGLKRIVGALDEDELSALARDEIVGGLLLIHDLHPVPLEERVQVALDQVRPYMKSHGGGVELLGIEQGVARLRLEGSCNGCGASTSTLELAVEKALEEAAPDLAGLEVEGAVTEPQVTGTPLPKAPADQGPIAVDQGPIRVTGWQPLGGVTDLADDELRSVDLDGETLLVARVGSELLAFHDRCVGCGSPLSGGALSEGVLACTSCERRYFLPRAGRSLDDERLQLAPVPLLRDGAAARVALHA